MSSNQFWLLLIRVWGLDGKLSLKKPLKLPALSWTFQLFFGFAVQTPNPDEQQPNHLGSRLQTQTKKTTEISSSVQKVTGINLTINELIIQNVLCHLPYITCTYLHAKGFSSFNLRVAMFSIPFISSVVQCALQCSVTLNWIS